jgi:hypothetical protein
MFFLVENDRNDFLKPFLCSKGLFEIMKISIYGKLPY